MLKHIGLDTGAGLSFCVGDTSFYREILMDYVEAYQGVRTELDKYFEDSDWHGFGIRIHALKSTSKTIGAIELSKRALSLEDAAEKGNESYIRENYLAFVQDYQELVQAVKAVMGI